MKKGIKDVFEAWKKETEKQKTKAFEMDKSAAANFAIEVLAADEEDQEQTLKMITERYEEIKCY